MKRNHQRCEDPNVIGNRPAATKRLAEFLPRAAHVVRRHSGIPDARGIHPQNTVPFRQAADDLRFAERIAAPIVAETNDVVVFNHIALTLVERALACKLGFPVRGPVPGNPVIAGD